MTPFFLPHALVLSQKRKTSKCDCGKTHPCRGTSTRFKTNIMLEGNFHFHALPYPKKQAEMIIPLEKKLTWRYIIHQKT
jgi:hypothetical protein